MSSELGLPHLLPLPFKVFVYVFSRLNVRVEGREPVGRKNVFHPLGPSAIVLRNYAWSRAKPGARYSGCPLAQQKARHLELWVSV